MSIPGCILWHLVAPWAPEHPGSIPGARGAGAAEGGSPALLAAPLPPTAVAWCAQGGVGGGTAQATLLAFIHLRIVFGECAVSAACPLTPLLTPAWFPGVSSPPTAAAPCPSPSTSSTLAAPFTIPQNGFTPNAVTWIVTYFELFWEWAQHNW